jgi:hypothetical protein
MDLHRSQPLLGPETCSWCGSLIEQRYTWSIIFFRFDTTFERHMPHRCYFCSEECMETFENAMVYTPDAWESDSEDPDYQTEGEETEEDETEEEEQETDSDLPETPPPDKKRKLPN